MRNVFAVALAAGLALLPVRAVRAQSPAVEAALTSASETHGLTYRFLRCLAWEETRFDPDEYNPVGYHGLFQYDWPTWRASAPRFGFAGYSPYHAWAAAHVTAGVIANQALWRTHGMWPPSKRCGSPWA